MAQRIDLNRRINRQIPQHAAKETVDETSRKGGAACGLVGSREIEPRQARENVHASGRAQCDCQDADCFPGGNVIQLTLRPSWPTSPKALQIETLQIGHA